MISRPFIVCYIRISEPNPKESCKKFANKQIGKWNHATLRNSISRVHERHVRVELIQDGIVKGWSPWVNATFKPEETIDLELKVDRWTWADESITHAGDYVSCLSIRNPYGDI